MKNSNWKIRLGTVLIIVSIPLFLGIAAIPFFEMENKVKISTIILVIAEILFWSGGLLLGKELFSKYKSYLNPKHWFKKNKTSHIEKGEQKEI